MSRHCPLIEAPNMQLICPSKMIRLGFYVLSLPDIWVLVMRYNGTGSVGPPQLKLCLPNFPGRLDSLNARRSDYHFAVLFHTQTTASRNIYRALTLTYIGSVLSQVDHTSDKLTVLSGCRSQAAPSGRITRRAGKSRNIY